MPQRVYLPLALLALGVAVLPRACPQSPGQNAGTVRNLPPRTVTLPERRMSVKEALKELTQQTGIAVAVRNGKGDTPINVKCKGLPFWQALDAIARAAGAHVALYSAEGIALVAAPGERSELPISYHGPFRTTVKHLAVRRDLETGTHICVMQLDLAWEPQMPVFLIGTGPATVVFARDAKGKDLRAELPARGQDQLSGSVAAHEITLSTQAPARSSPAIKTLKGTLVVTGASKMLTFTFDKIHEIGPKNRAEEQTREGVKVSLTEVIREKDPDRFIVEVTIDNPPGGPRFESYQEGIWLSRNAIWLERKGNSRQRLVPSKIDEEPVRRSAQHAVTRYHFTQKANPGVRFGKLSDWVLHYRTPGRLVEVTVPYEFKNVPLP